MERPYRGRTHLLKVTRILNSFQCSDVERVYRMSTAYFLPREVHMWNISSTEAPQSEVR